MLVNLPAIPEKKPLFSIVQKVEEPKQVDKPKPLEYKVKAGDSLTTISEAHKSSVDRLWSANPQLTDPNKIEPEMALKIPLADEPLEARPLPVVPVIEEAPTVEPVQAGKPTVVKRGSSSGNLYTPGYCTWYAKNMRPDLPNNLGNADTWYVRYNGPKGSTPAVGAVAVAKGYMHVAIVTNISGDSVTVSEANYVGWNVVSSRTTSASEFLYIY